MISRRTAERGSGVLVIEDDPGDVRLLREGLRDVEYDVTVVEDGRVDDLLGRVRDGEALPPTLVVLDLNLPGADGFDILERIKSTEELRSIPVIVFSTSTGDEDVSRAYELGANVYLPKRLDLDQHLSTIEILAEFWLSFARLPR